MIAESVNCTGEECIPFGSDADTAVKKCAEDGFAHYVRLNDAIEIIKKNIPSYISMRGFY